VGKAMLKPEEIKTAIECEDDFGHEMRVGDMLEKFQGLSSGHYIKVYRDSVIHGGTYVDQITNKPRQFDYRFRIWREVHTQKHQNVSFAVECKNLHPSSPLVITGRKRAQEETFHTFIHHHENGTGFSSVEGKMYKSNFLSQIYPLGEFVGKNHLKLSSVKNGKLCVDKNLQTDIYDRWSQAVASSRDLAENALWFARNRQILDCLSFIMPLVVVPDESLWKAEYDNSGKLSNEPVATNEVRYFIATPFCKGIGNFTSPWFVVTNIHFVTITGLKNLLESYSKTDGKIWEQMFPPNFVA
jgi:hypothetical protein